MPEISIIIPVYNAEKYLNQCMDSIINQTFTDIEIVCVNDGSTDDSLVILQDYQRKDNRIKIVNKINGGLVAARITGVSCSEGEYVSFVDADDWIDTEMYEKLYYYATKYNCDMVCSGLYRQFENSGVLNKNAIGEGLYDEVNLVKDVYPYMLFDGHFFQLGVRPNLVGKLIRKSIIQEVQKDAPEDVTNGEDVMITYPSLLKCNKVYLLDNAWYYYRQYPDSMSQKKAGEKEKIAIKHLYNYLKCRFEKEDCSEVLMKQLRYFIAHLLIQREPEIFDYNLGQLRMFGNIKESDKLLIYGAGRFGKQIYYYATENGRDVLWVDKKAKMYQEQGLPVMDVQALLSEQYEAVIVAVIDSKMADEIKSELESNGISGEIIKSLDLDYITSGAVLNNMGFNF